MEGVYDVPPFFLTLRMVVQQAIGVNEIIAYTSVLGDASNYRLVLKFPKYNKLTKIVTFETIQQQEHWWVFTYNGVIEVDENLAIGDVYFNQTGIINFEIEAEIDSVWTSVMQDEIKIPTPQAYG